jgi:hypothetical protein
MGHNFTDVLTVFQDHKYKGISLPSKEEVDSKNPTVWRDWLQKNNINQNEFIEDFLIYVGEAENSIFSINELYIETNDDRLYEHTFFHKPYDWVNDFHYLDIFEHFLKYCKDLSVLEEYLEYLDECYETDFPDFFYQYIKEKRPRYQDLANEFKIELE